MCKYFAYSHSKIDVADALSCSPLHWLLTTTGVESSRIYILVYASVYVCVCARVSGVAGVHALLPQFVTYN